MKDISIVAKEELSSTKFTKEEVIAERSEQTERAWNLYRAMLLGNLEHCKVKIVFKTESEDYQQVETTIWAFLEDYIILKGGNNIPIKAITRIEL